MKGFGIVVGDTFFGFTKEDTEVLPEGAEQSAQRLGLNPIAKYSQGCPYCGALGSHMCQPRGGGFA